MNLKNLIGIFLLSSLLFSCSSKKETFYNISVGQYFPLQQGKYITYKLDSLVYINFGKKDTTISYQVKYLTDSLMSDNTGRPAYRIFRFIRKNAWDGWTPDGTCMAVNTGSLIEFTEDNLKFIKLTEPIRNTFTWKGNSYINATSINSNLIYMQDWNYAYSNVETSSIIGNDTLQNTLTVEQRDETINDPQNLNIYSEVNFSKEIYARDIGLVYRKFLHREYQPNTNGTGGYVAEGSYGVTYTMIAHN